MLQAPLEKLKNVHYCNNDNDNIFSFKWMIGVKLHIKDFCILLLSKAFFFFFCLLVPTEVYYKSVFLLRQKYLFLVAYTRIWTNKHSISCSIFGNSGFSKNDGVYFRFSHFLLLQTLSIVSEATDRKSAYQTDTFSKFLQRSISSKLHGS